MRKINKRRSFYIMIICSLATAAVFTMTVPFHAKAVALPDTDKSEVTDLVQELEKNPALKEKVLKMLQNQNNTKDSVSDSTDSKLSEEQIGEIVKKGIECYNNKNYTEAIKWFRKAAEQGNSNAQYALGCCYGDGKGVKQDYAEAVKWFRKAAEQGNARAQSFLGGYYYNGYGVKQDYAEAIKWFRKAAEQGNALAQCHLGDCYYGGYGVKQDYAEAVKWFRKAAEQGNAMAQSCLGSCYYHGHGVKQDYAEAVKWFRKAAEQGNAIAQSCLGSCYYDGHGVKQDYAEAVKWLRKAVEQGFEPAQKMLSLINQNIELEKQLEQAKRKGSSYIPIQPNNSQNSFDNDILNNPFFNPEADYKLYKEWLQSLREQGVDVGPDPSFEDYMKGLDSDDFDPWLDSDDFDPFMPVDPYPYGTDNNIFGNPYGINPYNSPFGNSGKMDKYERQSKIENKKREIRRLEENVRYWEEKSARERANGEIPWQSEKFKLENEHKLIKARSDLDSLLRGE